MKPTELSPEKVILCAEQYLHVPFRMGGRSKDGIDCIGLIKNAFEDAGVVIDNDFVMYDEYKDYITILSNRIRERCVLVSKDDIQPADILLFREKGKAFHHVALYCGKGRIIHAYDSATFKRVVKHRMNVKWEAMLHSVFRYKGFVK